MCKQCRNYTQYLGDTVQIKKVPVSFRATELSNIVQQVFLCSQSRGQKIIWVIFVGKVATKSLKRNSSFLESLKKKKEESAIFEKPDAFQRFFCSFCCLNMLLWLSLSRANSSFMGCFKILLPKYPKWIFYQEGRKGRQEGKKGGRKKEKKIKVVYNT